MIKVVISYDMRDGKEQECQEYLVNRAAPLLANMGFQIADVWYTVWGSSPQVLSGGELDSLTDARRIFLSAEWREIEEKMEPLTDNLKLRVIHVEE